MSQNKPTMPIGTAVVSLVSVPLSALHGGALLWFAGLGPYALCAFAVIVLRAFGGPSWREAPTQPWLSGAGAVGLVLVEHVLLGGCCWVVLFVARGVSP